MTTPDSLTRASPPPPDPVAPVAGVPALAGGGGEGSDVVTSGAVRRGVCRLLARNAVWCLAEMPLRCGRRADLMGIDARGRIVLVEIKVSRADLLGDAKWPEYLAYCDRFYWAVPAGLDRAPLAGEGFLPARCGVIVADGYDGEIVRPAALVPLAAARRKVEVERLARTAMRRLVTGADPEALNRGWGDED